MVKLTEEMIVARTRVSDMANVKKLNCWGAELSDVSVLRKLVNVEVLSLSVNCISSLADLQNCLHLQELYIRKNKIEDLSELCWLRDLDNLRYLWLEENPCVQLNGPHYRLNVLRALPQLQKLDNVVVQPDERADALRRGQDLVHPLEREPIHQRPSRTSLDSLGARPPLDPDEDRGRYRDRSSADEGGYIATPSRRSSSNGPMEPTHIPPEYQTGRRLSHQERRSPSSGSGYRSLATMNEESGARRMSLQELGYEEDSPRRTSNYGDNYGSPAYGYQGGTYDQNARQEEGVMESDSFSSTTRLTALSEEPMHNGTNNLPTCSSAIHMRSIEGQETPRRGTSGSVGNFEHYADSAERMVARTSISASRRPRNRNSNILSAILCLIKELDGPSLEVVETAARCRIEEMHE